ncbi:MAG: hypothetical protein L3J62_11545 [Gammaproteobacteria bacterium]|nr:hypothetical protein [Gammaproteobacteria bacterium]MCF6231395.1 hypothetical protein [Gammaproteobacteria bacterium]
MNLPQHLIEAQALKYQAHLVHVTELVERVEQKGALSDAKQLYDALCGIKEERELLLTQIDTLKDHIHKACLNTSQHPPHPIRVWEAVANKLDGLINT